MERVISDALVQDPLAPEAEPHYHLDNPATFCYINGDGLIEVNKTIGEKNSVELPMLSIDGDWKLSWRHQPPLMKSMIEDLLLTAARNAPVTVRMNAPLKEIIDYTSKIINGIIQADGTGLNLHMLLCSKQFKAENNIRLYDIGFDRCTVVIPNLPDNRLIAIPDAEFLGAMPLRENKSFGAFVLLNNIINIELP